MKGHLYGLMEVMTIIEIGIIVNLITKIMMKIVCTSGVIISRRPSQLGMIALVPKDTPVIFVVLMVRTQK